MKRKVKAHDSFGQRADFLWSSLSTIKWKQNSRYFHTTVQQSLCALHCLGRCVPCVQGQPPQDLHGEASMWLMCPYLQVDSKNNRTSLASSCHLMWTLVMWAAVSALALLGWNNCMCFIDKSLELPPAKDINYQRWALELSGGYWAHMLFTICRKCLQKHFD